MISIHLGPLALGDAYAAQVVCVCVMKHKAFQQGVAWVIQVLYHDRNVWLDCRTGPATFWWCRRYDWATGRDSCRHSTSGWVQLVYTVHLLLQDRSSLLTGAALLFTSDLRPLGDDLFTHVQPHVQIWSAVRQERRSRHSPRQSGRCGLGLIGWQ